MSIETQSISPQLTSDGQLQHFLTLEGLTQAQLTDILNLTDSFLNKSDRSIKKVPLLRGKTVATLFFENSTRTRSTFELAAKRLSADVLNININTSATAKGETLLDTLRNLEAMSVDMFIVRHSSSGAAHFIAQQVTPEVAIVNAGDGQHSHPTQAMLDMYTIRHFKCGVENGTMQNSGFENLSVAIVGDVLHSRVARSQIHALNTLGVKDIRLVGPRTLLPRDQHRWPASTHTQLETGIKDADVVILLRLQKERMTSGMLPNENEYFSSYGLTNQRLKLAKPDAIVMHPGPINRGIEIDSEVADGPQSVILDQVHFGIATRMAILSSVMNNHMQARRT